jgi:hypothetical protein
VGLRTIAVVLLIAGVVIGFGKPLAIALAALGVVLVVLRQVLIVRPVFRRRPGKPAH